MMLLTRRVLLGSRPVAHMSRFGSSWVGAYLAGGFEVRQRIIQEEVIPLVGVDGLQDTLATDLSKTIGGVSAAIQLRIDLQQMASASVQSSPGVVSVLDKVVQNWLTATFCVDSLTLERVTFDSSGSALETIARADTVHAVRSISALKKRFESGRRCYALFHHALPTFPLAFIHVGLTTQLANSMRSLDEWKDGASPTHAMFYSVNSTSPAFRGLSLAPHLIKEVVRALQKDIPSIHTFSTLSPIPTFTKWLSKVKDVNFVPVNLMLRIQAAAALISGENATGEVLSDEKAWSVVVDLLINRPGGFDSNPQLQALLKEPLEWLACTCISSTKIAKDGSLAMQEPVANFHMSNGAEFHRVNYMGNPSLAGLKASVGMMVNYLYRLDSLDQNARLFVRPTDRNKAVQGGVQVLPLGPTVRETLKVV